MSLTLEQMLPKVVFFLLSYLGYVMACEVLFWLLHLRTSGVTWFVPSFSRRFFTWNHVFLAAFAIWKVVEASGVERLDVILYPIVALWGLLSWPEEIAAGSQGLKVTKLGFWNRRFLPWHLINGISLSDPSGTRERQRVLVWATDGTSVEYTAGVPEASAFLELVKSHAPYVLIQPPSRESFVSAYPLYFWAGDRFAQPDL
jgi:hypothetical protein